MIEALVLKDSVSASSGHRITTVQATFHRFILAEQNTHRAVAKSSASSRAIPVKRRIQDVLENTAFPVHWGANQAGMQAGEELAVDSIAECKAVWEQASRDAVAHVERLLELGLHKQVANRLLEPFLWHTAIMTATEKGWQNYFNQRCSPLAQPEMEASANSIKAVYDASVPKVRHTHTPYVSDEEMAEWGKEIAVPVSVARSARVSYKTFDGNIDPEADLVLFDKLMSASPKHWAPTEHVAFDSNYFMDRRLGPFAGWTPLRHSVYMRPLLDLRGLEFEVSL